MDKVKFPAKRQKQFKKNLLSKRRIKVKNAHLHEKKGNRTSKIKVKYGDHFTKGKRGKKVLKANVRYEDANGYAYETDSKGRIVKAYTTNKLISQKGRRNYYAQRTVGDNYRKKDDDGGHLFGTQFNGSGDIDNLLPQNSKVNRSGGEWYNMEKEWASALGKGSTVTVSIFPRYIGKSKRPSVYMVFYSIDGEEHRKIVRNY